MHLLKYPANISGHFSWKTALTRPSSVVISRAIRAYQARRALFSSFPLTDISYAFIYRIGGIVGLVFQIELKKSQYNLMLK